MAVNSYIKFEDPAIAGGSTASGHEKQIEILSWSHSFNQPTSATQSTGGAGTTEQANHADFSFSVYMDSALRDLLMYCWNGKTIGKATVACYRASGAATAESVKYLEVYMEKIIISNVSLSGGGGDIPIVNLSLAYGLVKYTYTPQSKASGEAGSPLHVQHNLQIREIS